MDSASDRNFRATNGLKARTLPDLGDSAFREYPSTSLGTIQKSVYSGDPVRGRLISDSEGTERT
jgi:hypothetical protein